MTGPELLFRGARVVDPPGGVDEVADVLVRDGVVAEVGREAASASAESFDCDGLVLARASWIHRISASLGFEHKETIETGTRAAAAGATRRSLRWPTRAGRRRRIRDRRGPRRRRSRRPRGRLPRRRDRAGAGGRDARRDRRDGRVGGPRVQRRRAVRPDRAYPPQRAHVRARVRRCRDVEHCEDASLSIGQQMHEGIGSYSLGLAGQPSAAEDAMVFRDIEMARLTGGRLHICTSRPRARSSSSGGRRRTGSA